MKIFRHIKLMLKIELKKNSQNNKNNFLNNVSILNIPTAKQKKFLTIFKPLVITLSFNRLIHSFIEFQ